MEQTTIDYVVIGVGINVNQSIFDTEIATIATSIALELGRKITRTELIGRILHYFEKEYAEFAKTYDLGSLMERYNGYLLNRDTQVRVLDPKGEYEGFALGINSQGELMVKRQNGEIEAVYAGEVSVRGIYGYV